MYLLLVRHVKLIFISRALVFLLYLVTRRCILTLTGKLCCLKSSILVFDLFLFEEVEVVFCLFYVLVTCKISFGSTSFWVTKLDKTINGVLLSTVSLVRDILLLLLGDLCLFLLTRL